jgi:UDP-N-acetylmuramoyl-L-alanyl-D-glutamate--2,6-diaminopimelate ligase
LRTDLGTILTRLEGEGLLRDVTLPGEVWQKSSIEHITADSRCVEAGSLFCAIRGTEADGHRFLPQARERGAIGALVEEMDTGVDLPQVVVRDSRRAAAFAAAALYADPWRELTMIGVTGTNGKTTTVSILRHLLAERVTAASIGTLGVVGSDGLVVPGTEGLTTPGPGQFAATLRDLADGGVKAVAMEVSSHALAQERVCAAEFQVGVFTNLSRDHLDYHGTLESYREAKLRLVDLVAPGGALVVNADDPAWDGVARQDARVVRFSRGGEADVRAEGMAFRSGGVEFQLHTPTGDAHVALPLFGVYNVENALAAASALWAIDWETADIADALARVPQVPGRLERIPGPAGGPAIALDYAHTPDALERALKALRPLVSGRLIVLFGAGGDRDRGKRAEMGQVAAENADFVIVTTDNPRHEDPVRIAEDIEAGLEDGSHLRILDRREAIERAIDLGTAGDLVLLAGKGHETYQIWGDEKRPFDERQIVGEILQRKGRGA